MNICPYITYQKPSVTFMTYSVPWCHWSGVIRHVYKSLQSHQITVLLLTAVYNQRQPQSTHNWTPSSSVQLQHGRQHPAVCLQSTTEASHELHWLDILERTQFRTAVTVHRCLNGLTPAYLRDRGIMRLCACIILRIIADLSHNWVNPA